MTQLQNSAGSDRMLADGSRSIRNKLHGSKNPFESIWPIFCPEICDRTLEIAIFHEKCPFFDFRIDNKFFKENSDFKCPVKVSDHKFPDNKIVQIDSKSSLDL